MPIAINGSGTLTGISVGGLPDGIVDADMLAANAVTAGKLATGVAGSWKKLSTTTVSSNVDNVTFTNSITDAFDTYKMYAIVFNQFRSTADDYNFYIRIQESGSTVSSGVYRWRVFSPDGNSNGQGDTQFRCNKDAVGNVTASDNNEDVSGILYFSGFSSSKRLRYRSEIIFGTASADNNADFSGGGINNINETTGILFYPQNGQWSTGTATLYGIAQ